MNEKPLVSEGLGSIDLAGVATTQPADDSIKHQCGTKEFRILTVLKTRSLNTFEARHFGDSCLHTTIATLRSKGYEVVSQWEKVPTRFGKPARVKRYWIAPDERHAS